MSIVSGLLDTTDVFNFRKRVISTVGSTLMTGEVEPPPIITDATPSGRRRPGDVSYIDPAVHVQGYPQQYLRSGADFGIMNGTAADPNIQKLPFDTTQPETRTAEKAFDEYVDTLNTPPLLKYNGTEFKLPAAFMTR